MKKRPAATILFLLCAVRAEAQSRERPGETRSEAPGQPIDLHVDRLEHIEVHGNRPRFKAAPMPGHAFERYETGPSERAIYDPKSGASIGAFGIAYALAAPR